MILSDFLSRQKHDNSNPHEIILISFNMHCVLHDRYYNTGNLGRYMVQTRSQSKLSGIKLPEAHGVSKGLDPHTQSQKHIIKPMISKTRRISQIKPRLGQERAGLRCKIKTQISEPIVQTIERPLKIPDIPKTQDKVMTISNFAIPPMQSKGNSGTKMIDRKTIQDVAREIPIYPDPVYRPPPKPVKTSLPKIPGSLSDIDPELNMDFENNSPFQEGVISETYQRPDKSYFQEPQELESD